MTIPAVALIVVSAFTHVGWNLLSKNERPSAAFMLVANTLGTVWLLPAIILYGGALRDIPAQVWGLVVGAGIFQAIYFTGLAGAYRTGEMSVAYPLARATPVLLVALINLAWGRGDQLTAVALAGMVLVVGGSLLVPRQRFTGLSLRSYLSLSPALALMAALGTSGYSIVDDQALRHLRAMSGPGAEAVLVTMVYAFLEGVSTTFSLGATVVARSTGREELRQVLRGHLRHAWWAGLGIHFTYALVLVAMAYAVNVSYIVAFRQLSIPLGAMLGVVLLGEPPHVPKLTGVALMFGGLVLVAAR